MCGEHARQAERTVRRSGSSPHVQGAPLACEFFDCQHGIIPACAGSTASYCSISGLSRDHPRMCGEHYSHFVEHLQASGSSPHVRGALSRTRNGHQTLGIIPACAGSTVAEWVNQRQGRDHPRMCGEHVVYATIFAKLRGSSPHVRGAQSREIRDAEACGIIPACAGSTKCVMAIFVSERDHPRMCGEHGIGMEKRCIRMGSSPHVRGALRTARIARGKSGIIPACAGSTEKQSTFLRADRDHPRMCGEHWNCGDVALRTAGSSPHVRGAHDAHPDRRRGQGIIPACAGSTGACDAESLQGRDHPRMCGEHNIVFVPYNLYRGSSPHVRGARIWNYGTRHASGIIPACAGSTSD